MNEVEDIIVPIIKSRRIAEILNDMERKETMILAGGIKIQVRLYHTEGWKFSFWRPAGDMVMVWRVEAKDEGLQLCSHLDSSHDVHENRIDFSYDDYESALTYFNRLVQKYRG